MVIHGPTVRGPIHSDDTCLMDSGPYLTIPMCDDAFSFRLRGIQILSGLVINLPVRFTLRQDIR